MEEEAASEGSLPKRLKSMNCEAKEAGCKVSFGLFVSFVGQCVNVTSPLGM